MNRMTWPKSGYLVVSGGLSFVVHLLLYALFGCIPFLPGAGLRREAPRLPSRTVHLAEVRLPIPEATPSVPPRRAELLPVPPPQAKLPAPGPGAAPANRPGPPTELGMSPPPDLPALPIPPAIIEIPGENIPPARAEFNRLIIPTIPREPALHPPLAAGTPVPDGPPPPLQLAMRLTPPSAPVPPRLPVVPETRLLPPEESSILDQLVAVSLTVEPLSDGGGFFRIALLPRPQATSLQPWRKDLVFILDVSGSISQAKLNEFIQGVRLALPRMAADDRFEIIAFRHREYRLFGEFRQPTAENLKAADEFLFKLQRVGSTNIYAALTPLLADGIRAPDRPLLVFLCSDGQVNFGEIVDSRELINTFSNRNRDNASIFCFSAGAYANPFLMDLLSYRNRGESRQTEGIARSRLALAAMIEQVADVVVADLDYQVSSELANDTFPKRLPHLYRSQPLTIYGRYPAGTREIGLRLVGRDAFGERQELVWRGDLAKAGTAAPGELATRWAMQRIYHLYSRLTATGDDNLRHDIRAVAREYRLQTPYLDTMLAPRRANYVKP